MKSKYQSSKSVAKNPTVPISADDPRVAWNKINQTKSRQGAEVDIVGLNGKSLVSGGTSASNASGAASTAQQSGTKTKAYVPPSNGKPGYNLDGDSIIPTPVTNVAATWDGEDLVVTFDWDYSNDLNLLVSHFILQLTVDSVVKRTPLTSFVPNTSGAALLRAS